MDLSFLYDPESENSENELERENRRELFKVHLFVFVIRQSSSLRSPYTIQRLIERKVQLKFSMMLASGLADTGMQMSGWMLRLEILPTRTSQAGHQEAGFISVINDPIIYEFLIISAEDFSLLSISYREDEGMMLYNRNRKGRVSIECETFSFGCKHLHIRYFADRDGYYEKPYINILENFEATNHYREWGIHFFDLMRSKNDILTVIEGFFRYHTIE